MSPPLSLFPDPRVPATVAPPEAASWFALAEGALGATTGAVAHALTARLAAAVAQALATNPATLDAAIEAAPTPEIARHLWRTADRVWEDSAGGGGDLALTAFALPLVIVAGGNAAGDVEIPGTLGAPERVAAILAEGSALGGSETVAVSPVLATATACMAGQWTHWRALQLPAAGASPADDAGALFTPAPLLVQGGAERVFLRFLVGTALAAPGRDLLTGSRVGAWGAGLTAELVRELTRPGATVLALPRVPARPLPAGYDGQAAQREVSAQLFATNAIRKLRGGYGEPTAVISAHRASAAAGGGELRLSLSSPFAPRDAEGFRCPILPTEPVGVPLRMLTELMADCRVADVRLLAGVHPDRTPGTPMPLFFKAETIPDGALLQ